MTTPGSQLYRVKTASGPVSLQFLAPAPISNYLGLSATAAIETKLRTDSAALFLDSVLQLHPRVAAFDCDGTLWSGDGGEGFFHWELEQGIVTDRIVRIPSGPGKPLALRKVVEKEIDVAFGNSRWDAEMLAIAKHAFAVNPNPDLEAIARQRNWTVYFPNATTPK